jgi:hypothetical protein
MPDGTFMERLDAIERLKFEQLPLKVRREQRQVHDLRDPRSGQPEPPGHLGPVRNQAAIDRVLDVIRERQHAGDLRGPSDRLGLWGRRLLGERHRRAGRAK